MTATAFALVALLAGADPAPAFKCKGELPKDIQTQDLRKRTEDTDFFKLAVQQLGAPQSCAVKWTRDEGEFATLTYKFEKGSASFASLPPETEIITLEAGGGFADEAAVRAFFKDVEAVKQFNFDWKKKPEVTVEKGEKKETYWSADEGDNAAVDFTFKGGKLIRASFHFAL